MTMITFNGSPLKTSGSLPAVGSKAPDFTVTKADLSDVSLKNYQGKQIVLNIFPSLDTSTCANAMRHFNELATQLKHVVFLCISADLPFAQKRFCVAEQLTNVVAASTFRHPEFGKEYGVLILEGPLQGLLSRAVLLLDKEHTVLYTEQVKELSDEPNYATLKAAFEKEKSF